MTTTYQLHVWKGGSIRYWGALGDKHPTRAAFNAYLKQVRAQNVRDDWRITRFRLCIEHTTVAQTLKDL